MKRLTGGSHGIDGVFVFLLLGVFAVFSTVMVALGARAYRGTAARLSEHNLLRIAPAYVRSMLRADGGPGKPEIEEIAGVTALRLTDDYDGETYITRIYCWDGMLREWFMDGESEFLPEDGEAVCPLDSMTAELAGGLLTVMLERGDEAVPVSLALRAAM